MENSSRNILITFYAVMKSSVAILVVLLPLTFMLGFPRKHYRLTATHLFSHYSTCLENRVYRGIKIKPPPLRFRPANLSFVVLFFPKFPQIFVVLLFPKIDNPQFWIKYPIFISSRPFFFGRASRADFPLFTARKSIFFSGALRAPPPKTFNCVPKCQFFSPPAGSYCFPKNISRMFRLWYYSFQKSPKCWGLGF